MKKLIMLSSLLSVAGPSTAFAANGTFVQPSSQFASDSGTCTLAQPCVTITKALSVTDPTGQVNIVGPGDFAESLTITKGVTLVAVHGDVRLLPPSGQPGITITAGTSDNINLSGFQIVGTAGGTIAVGANSLAKLQMNHMSIGGFSGVGISFSPNTAGSLTPTLYIEHSSVRYTGGNILVAPTNSLGAIVDLKHVTSQFSATYGIRVDASGTSGQVQATISDSEFTNITNNGILAVTSSALSRIMVDHTIVAHMSTNGVAAVGTGAQIVMNNSTITFANAAIFTSSGGIVSSYGNNAVNFVAGASTFTSGCCTFK
jgi:hypothetical protein